MRTNSNLFWILGAFFWLADLVYIVWSLIDTGRVEWVGTVAMALSGILAFFVAFYVGRTHASQGGELPQDRADANVDDGDPEMGQFSPWSWWPFALAVGIMLVFLGLAIGPWISFFGGPIALIAIVGWNYEYYRNNFAR
ncbi:cytochrome c oxidase subunit 4 [Pseudolysinimonas sp.]|uniref:cytochrome c oxidase subunit 4 n=1 Tax=Pseudolysinimonas sp. TaxID=2680009 RepID=UPI003F80A812